MSRSEEYIFKKNNGKLELVGDFEGYYQNNDDPWDQISTISDISDYYGYSRMRLIRYVESLGQCNRIMEVGCGLGIVSDMLKKSTRCKSVYGIDISKTAIEKAKLSLRDINFSVGDISSSSFKFNKNMNIIILNQMLWYILEDLDLSIKNIYSLLEKNGYLIISMAFLDRQEYGVEIINGFEGLMQYCQENLSDRFKLVFSDFDTSGKFPYSDGLVSLRKV
jgi:SAM-dependent methyltransferase